MPALVGAAAKDLLVPSGIAKSIVLLRISSAIGPRPVGKWSGEYEMEMPGHGPFRAAQAGATSRPGDPPPEDACDWREILGSMFGGLFNEPLRFESLMDSIERGRVR